MTQTRRARLPRARWKGTWSAGGVSGRQRAAWIHYRRLEYEMMMLTPAIYRTWHRKNGEEDEEKEQEEERGGGGVR